MKLRCTALLISVLAFGKPVAAQAVNPVIQQGKLATALVVLPFDRGSGSGFCIGPNGFFITDAHVVEGLPADARVTVVMNAAERDELTLSAWVINVDEPNDLALLGCEAPRALPYLELGDAETLVETAPVAAFGYPFGELLTAAGAQYPSVSVNMAHISSLRRVAGRLEILQLDSQLNPGNSGGPVLDAKGDVVGVVCSGIPFSGINFAIPVNAVTAFLSRPSVTFVSLPKVSYDNRREPVDLSVQVLALDAAAARYDVEFLLNAGLPGDPRRYRAKPDGESTYTARVRPLPEDALGAADPGEVKCKAVVWQNDRAVAEREVTLRFGPRAVKPGEPVPVPEGLPPAGTADSGPAYIPPTMLEDVTEVRLPGNYSDMRIGAGGRYLVFRIPQLRSLAIFDVGEGKVVRQIALPSDDVMFAAGAEKLVVVLRDQSLLLRYDLTTFEREQTVPFLDAAALRWMVLGPRSRGPLFVWSTDGQTITEMQAVSLDNLQRFPMEGLPRLDPGYNCSLRPSYNGQAMSFWYGSVGHDPSRYMRVEGGKMVTYQFEGDPNRGRWQMPNGDGSYIFDHAGVIRDGFTRRDVSGETFKGSVLIPCLDDRFFLALKNSGLYVCSTSDRRLLISAGRFAEMQRASIYVSENEPRYYYYPSAHLENEPRYYYYPSAHLVVTLPASNDRVVLRPFDLAASLNEAGIDYLFVDSMPPTELLPGAALSYQLSARSRAGGFKYKLESGPDGMKVSDTGLLTWEPGAARQPGRVAVVISITDGGGQEAFHSFQFVVR